MKIIISNSSITMRTQRQLVPLTNVLTELAQLFNTAYVDSYSPYCNWGTDFVSYTGEIAGVRLMADIGDSDSIPVYKIKIQDNEEISRTLVQTFLPQGMTQGTKVTNDLIFDSPVTLGADEYLFVGHAMYSTDYDSVTTDYKTYFFNNHVLSKNNKACASFDWLVPSEQ